MDSLLHAFIFLAAGVIAVPIATRLGLGSVLGYLIAGALIGPFAMGFIDDAERLMHFSEFGVVMMLFLIGIELQPSVLWRMRIPILGLGGLQMVITTAAIGGVAYGLGQSWENSLAIGLILALSSTAIALQVLDEKNLMKTQSGKSGFAVLLFQDIAVIPIIAVLPLLAIATLGSTTGTDTSHATESTNLILHLPGWQKAIIVIGTVLGIILAGRFLTRPLFRYIAESRLRELFTATALMLVMGIAVLMNMVGLSPALGAFVAGVVLADSEYRHELEANIDPFKTLLLGLFFISVGASIDFKLLALEPLLIFSVVVGLVLIKLLILLLLGGLFDLKGGPRYWFAFTLAQGGEFGFVLLSFSLQNQVLPKATVDILTAAIALSMVLTPILVVLNEKFIQPKYQHKDTTDVNNEEMEDQDDAVIIAGFGRFGQVAGRLLIANDIPVTVLDHSAAHIERVRRFGFKIFYGDASREDLLHTAGAHKAKLLIIAIDDKEKTRKIIDIVKHNYPHLKIYTRAFDAIHYHELKAAGADYIEREMFLSSLKVGEKALEALGMRAYQARRQALRFAEHDRMSTDRIGQHLDDNTRFVSETRIAHTEVLELLRRDRKIAKTAVDHAWDPSGHE